MDNNNQSVWIFDHGDCLWSVKMGNCYLIIWQVGQLIGVIWTFNPILIVIIYHIINSIWILDYII